MAPQLEAMQLRRDRCSRLPQRRSTRAEAAERRRPQPRLRSCPPPGHERGASDARDAPPAGPRQAGAEGVAGRPGTPSGSGGLAGPSCPPAPSSFPWPCAPLALQPSSSLALIPLSFRLPYPSCSTSCLSPFLSHLPFLPPLTVFHLFFFFFPFLSFLIFFPFPFLPSFLPFPLPHPALVFLFPATFPVLPLFLILPLPLLSLSLLPPPSFPHSSINEERRASNSKHKRRQTDKELAKCKNQTSGDPERAGGGRPRVGAPADPGAGVAAALVREGHGVEGRAGEAERLSAQREK